MTRTLVVHERFTEVGGSEYVVAELVRAFPEASVYVAVDAPRGRPPGLEGTPVRSDPLLARLARGGGYAHLLPLLPWAMRRADLTVEGQLPDVVITSHHAFAQRIRPPAELPWVSYVHTPARWIWDATKRAGEVGGPMGAKALAAFAATQRGPDRRAAQRPDVLVANSSAVAGRISQWWGRESVVVHPPVRTEFFTLGAGEPREDFFLVAGRLVPYKRPEVAVAAARAAGVRLVVAGDGRSRAATERLAGAGVELLGRVGDERLRDLMRRARAVVFPGEEDFGIVPVEAMACGTPVIALGSGGALDTVVDGVTGVLVTDPGVAAFADALRGFDDSGFDRSGIRRHAEGFGADRFREEMAGIVHGVVAGTRS